jgi:hypothetical protein
MTQRLPRSSRTPGLMFPPTNSAAPAMTKSATTSAINAGWEKKAPGRFGSFKAGLAVQTPSVSFALSGRPWWRSSWNLVG